MKVDSLFIKNLGFYLEKNEDTFIILDSCSYKKDKYSEYDYIIAFGEEKTTKNNLTEFNNFNKSKDWQFGYFSYDLKNQISPDLNSNNINYFDAPDLFFFIPKNIFLIKNNILKVEKNNIKDINLFFNEIKNYKIDNFPKKNIDIKNRISKTEYLKKLEKIKTYIQKGDIYEVNFAQEFYSENTVLNPIKIFLTLKEKSKSPFSSLFKFQDNYIICSSPERYIKKEDDKLISQPIKGTSKRGNNFLKDFILKQQLKNSLKEVSENTMIVDLVRNDLARVTKKGNVNVEEFCKVYSFKSVHQLISTIVCKLKDNISIGDILKNTFPMGSMTGAPKLSSMKIIEELETTKRGIYSGSLGYIKPNKDFDFNVIIRTILYNKKKKYLSFTTGGAITNKSIPKKEYEECLVKASAINETLK